MEPRPAAGARTPRDLVLVAILCLVAVLGVLAQALPLARAGCCLTPDAVEYLGTAHSWLAGAGFVDPISYTFYLEGVRPPLPAFAVRPPAISFLLALPLALGAGVAEILVWHAVWAAALAAAALLVARRTLSLPAAAAFALAVTWSPGWMFVAPKPLTEVTSVGALLLVMACLRAGTASLRGALLLALLTLLAWLVRPNLGLVLPAVVLAVVLERGPRAALRARPLWLYVGAFALLYGAVVLAVTAATGLAPYAHFGAKLEVIDTWEYFLYRKPYIGGLAYLQANSAAVLAAVVRNLGKSWDLLFGSGFYWWVGWPALPALGYAFWRRGEGSLERRFAACAALVFTALAVVTYGDFDAKRYLLLGVVCAWFTVAAAADAFASGLAARLASRGPGLVRTLRWLPLLGAAALFAIERPSRAFVDPWSRWQQVGPTYEQICAYIDRDALVASENPWWLYLWCGNAGLHVPYDLDRRDWLHRFLDDQRPDYLLVPRQPRWQVLARSPRLRRVAAGPDADLYELLERSGRVWRAPPPLARIE